MINWKPLYEILHRYFNFEDEIPRPVLDLPAKKIMDIQNEYTDLYHQIRKRYYVSLQSLSKY